MEGRYVTIYVDGRQVGIVEEEDVEIAMLLLKDEYLKGSARIRAIHNVKEEIKRDGNASDLVALGIAHAAQEKIEKEKAP